MLAQRSFRQSVLARAGCAALDGAISGFGVFIRVGRSAGEVGALFMSWRGPTGSRGTVRFDARG